MNDSNVFPKVSKDGKLQVQALGLVEPNNGRMLWEVEVFYEEVNLNEFIFPKGWSYLNFNLTGWVLEDEKSHFFYIPVETQSILINAKTLAIYKLSVQSLSTAGFEGNYFKDGFLVEIYEDVKIMTNLKTLVSEEIKTYKK